MGIAVALLALAAGVAWFLWVCFAADFEYPTADVRAERDTFLLSIDADGH